MTSVITALDHRRLYESLVKGTVKIAYQNAILKPTEPKRGNQKRQHTWAGAGHNSNAGLIYYDSESPKGKDGTSCVSRPNTRASYHVAVIVSQAGPRRSRSFWKKDGDSGHGGRKPVRDLEGVEVIHDW